MDDTELLAAIGRIVVNAATLEYAVAELVAVAEGLRGEDARQERAVAIVRVTGQAMRLLRRLAERRQDRDLSWLLGQVEFMLGARHFVPHSVAQEDAVAEGRPALFILQPRHGETMITAALASKNAQMIGEGIGWVQERITMELAR
jgi:hypothetical protein